LNTVASNEGTSVPSILMNGDGSSSSPYEISTASDLQSIKYDKGANYTVVNDIDASGTVNWNNGQGFNPVGTFVYEQANSEFTGSFDGQNHTISNLSINRLDAVGLFGRIGAGGEVKNVGVINVNMTGDNNVGGLVGYTYNGTISNSYSTGNVTGREDVGGLVGDNDKNGTISNSYSTGNVTGEEDVGGLVGENDNGSTISNSYSTGNVTGESDDVGGLVGSNKGSNISNSYSTGNVTGVEEVGGLVGRNWNNGTVSNSYWDTESTGQSSSAFLPDSNGLTTSEMQGSSAKDKMDFDFKDTWSTVTGDYPELQWQE
jgi:hypothetical protein